MKALSPTMEEGGIQKWKVKEGDKVTVGQPLCDVETDKATMEYESDSEGVLLKIIKGPGSSAKVGDVIAIIGEAGEDIGSLVAEVSAGVPPKAAPAVAGTTPTAPAASSAPAQNSAAPAAGGRVKASPLAKKIAADKGVDIGQISGTGPAGRVVKADVEGFTPSARGSFAPVSTGFSALNNDRVPVSRKRGVIAKRLGESLFTAPHFFLTLSIQMDSLMEARDRINEKRKEKIGLNPFIIKFCAEAIKRHQAVNSTWEGDFIQNFASVDIGVAVAQPDGLITPVVRDAGSKGILQIDAEFKDLIDRARLGSLKPEEYTNATFTISNLGSFGIEEFTAIINPPGSAILALGSTVKTPVIDENDELQVRKVMKVTLSCDHRVIDGAVGAGFLKDLKDMIEDPYRVLL